MSIQAIRPAAPPVEDEVQVIRGLIGQELAATAASYLLLKAEIGEMQVGDSQIPNSLASYADLLMEVLLTRVQPTIEAATKADLLPTHSYTRLYRRGDELKPHTDRPACEVVVSITLGSSPQQEWPIHLRKGNETHRIVLADGDGVVYPGAEYEHWREPFSGDWQAQVTLHYVRAGGPMAVWQFDRRPGLGWHSGTRRL